MDSFVVDSNFFIQAHRATYPLDVVVSFWRKIAQLALEGKIISIDKVKNEIYQNDDELRKWCITNLPDVFFKDTSRVIPEYTQVVNWAVSRKSHFQQKALDEFLDADEADAWLISYSIANHNTIITQEILQPEKKNKIKIPDACIPFRIHYMNTIEMFRQLGEQF